MQPNIIFVPSAGGSSKSSFYQSVGEILSKSGFDVDYLDIPEKDLLDEKIWLSELAKLESKITTETYIVSHSNGSFATARFLLESNLKIKAWHIVASSFEPTKIKSTSGEFAITQAQNLLGKKPFDWKKLNQNCEFITLHYSLDDTVVEFDTYKTYRQHLPKTSLQRYSSKGHFGESDFPELTQLILRQEKNSWTEVDGKKLRVKVLQPENLPLVLPEVKDYLPTSDGRSPLGKSDWINLKDQNGNIIGLHESDTMPNWAGSSWYYLRYADPKNTEAFASQENLNYWLPVDHYFGGNEHTTLHLLYSRFWHKFLYDQGYVPTPEPYQKRTNGGILLGPDGSKMSKSKGNVVNIKEKLKDFGADAVRLYIAFIGPYDATVIWNDGGLKACKKLVDTIFNLSQKVVKNDKKVEAEIRQTTSEYLQKGFGIVVDGIVFNKQNQIFAQKRLPHRRLYPNQWDLLGGHVEKDEDPILAIKREVLEESGLEVKKILKIVDTVEWENDRAEKMLAISTLVEPLGDLNNPKVETEKVSEYKWIDGTSLETLRENKPQNDTYIYKTAKKALETLRENKPEKPKYLIFDFDGVLADTWQSTVESVAQIDQTTLEIAANSILETHQKPMSEDRPAQPNLEDRVDRILILNKLVVEKGFELFVGFLKEIEAIPNTKIAVVSSGSREYLIAPVLSKFNLKFDFILGIEDHVSKVQKVQEISKKWEVDLSEIYFFTDTVSDVVELQPILDKQKIIGCSWGWHGVQRLETVLNSKQILNKFSDIHSTFEKSEAQISSENKKLSTSYHKFIKNISEQTESMRNNVAVAEIMTFVNILKDEKEIPEWIWNGFLRAIAPFAPFIAEELWYKLNNFDENDAQFSVHLTSWPVFDPEMVVDESVTIAIQVNGKLRGTIQTPKDSPDDLVLDMAQKEVAKWLENQTLKFSKVVPNKIVTLVVK
jgi:8-oxo-dGTP pyrophosphatase MutT (NUDIX family)/predicted alpha/beta hydrolase family esterase